MANTTKPLTNTEVKQSKARDKEYNLSDGGGLALRIKPNGSKLWLFNYSRPFTKKRANIGLGTFPALSLAEARKQREEFRSLLIQDIDPKEYRDEQNAKSKEEYKNTLEHITKLWLETHYIGLIESAYLKKKNKTGKYDGMILLIAIEGFLVKEHNMDKIVSRLSLSKDRFSSIFLINTSRKDIRKLTD